MYRFFYKNNHRLQVAKALERKGIQKELKTLKVELPFNHEKKFKFKIWKTSFFKSNLTRMGEPVLPIYYLSLLLHSYLHV